MKTLFCVLAFVPAVSLAGPLAPIEMNLDDSAIHSIPLHPEIDTLLVFPGEVTLIHGHGLTKGEHPGKVFCQQAEDAKLVILRPLEEDITVLMQIVMDGRAFVFRLSGSDRPASIIRLRLAGQTPPAVEIAATGLRDTRRSVSQARLEELVRLAREAPFLKPRLPHEYEGFESKRVSISSYLHKNVSAEITGLARFQNEDTLIVFGRIRNEGTASVRLDDGLRLKVGDKRLYSFSKLDIVRRHLQPGAQTQFRAALVGDGRGRPLHLSLDNRFTLQPAE